MFKVGGKIQYILLCVLVFLPGKSFATIGEGVWHKDITETDDFEDGDLTSGFSWGIQSGFWLVTDDGDSNRLMSFGNAEIYTPIAIQGRRFETVEIEGFVKLLPGNGDMSFLLVDDEESSSLEFVIETASPLMTGAIEIYSFNAGVSTFHISDTLPVSTFDGAWHAVRCVWRSDNSYEFWLDGKKRLSGMDDSNPVPLNRFQNLGLSSTTAFGTFDDIKINLNRSKRIKQDNFEDGETQLEPNWNVDSGSWIVREGVSRYGRPTYWLKAEESGSQVSTPVDWGQQRLEVVEMKFRMRLSSDNGYAALRLLNGSGDKYLEYRIYKVGVYDYNTKVKNEKDKYIIKVVQRRGARTSVISQNGNEPIFETDKPLALTSSDTEWHDVRLVWRYPNRYAVVIDNTKQLPYTNWADLDYLYPTEYDGGIRFEDVTQVALYASDGKAEFDDLKIDAQAFTPAFEGAYGYGAVTIGGRGGDVYVVDNLSDYLSGQAVVGTLRHAIETANGPRTIVFNTGGTISLLRDLTINHPYITIAGHTSPGGGITIRDFPTTVKAHDVILQNLRFRVGARGIPCPGPREECANSLNVDSNRVIVDHCSVSWSTDDNISTTGDRAGDVTIQNCLVSEDLYDEQETGEGGHSKAIFLSLNAYNDIFMSLHNNVLAHNDDRNPLVTSKKTDAVAKVDWINNIIYDYGIRLGRTNFEKSLGKVRWNYVDNLVIKGPSSISGEPIMQYTDYANTDKVAIYLSGNEVWDGGSQYWGTRFQGDDVFVSEYIGKPEIDIQPAHTLYGKLLSDVGASLPKRDDVDIRVIRELEQRTGRIILWEDFSAFPNTYYYPDLEPGIPALDSDKDGMPDGWEIQKGLDPNDPADASSFNDKNGFAQYTNLELYLHSLYAGYTHHFAKGEMVATNLLLLL